MEIETVAVLGNNFVSKIIALSLKINHPQIDVKIFTNGEDYKQQIISTQYNPFTLDCTLTQFFLKHCNITTSDLFERTNSTVGHAVLFDGISDREILIPMKRQHLNYRDLVYQCNKKNVLKKLTPHQQYLAFIEYLIQTDSNVIETITSFPFNLYQNQENLYRSFFRYNFPKREDVTWQMLPGCYDIESLNILLDEKIAEYNITKINDIIGNIDCVEVPIIEDKNFKTITALYINETGFPVDFVINTGIDNSFLNSFIASADTLTETNDTIVFSGYQKQDLDFCEPAILKNKIQDNQFSKNLYYQDKTTEIIFSNEINNIKKDQNKFLVNDLYNSNYIEFNIENLGLNPMLNEDLLTTIVYSDEIILTVGSIVIDSDNINKYLDKLQNNWTNFRINLKKFAYYLFQDNAILGYEALRTVPNDYATNFQNKVPSFTVDLYNEILYGNKPEKDAYSIFDYILLAAQLARITNFDYQLSDLDVFEKLAIFIEFEKNEDIFSINHCNFDTFKNLVLLETPDYNPNNSTTEYNGITYETYIEYVPVTRVRIIHNDI